MIALTEQEALTCCSSPKWAQLISGSYASVEALFEKAKSAWWKEVGVTEWLAAFAAHPKIGDKVEGKPPAFAAFSQSEQAAAAQSATRDVSIELQHWNRLYFDKFGIIFIICARGRSSQEILAALKDRCGRTPYEELQAAAREQMQITLMRLQALVSSKTPQGSDLEVQQRTQKRADQVLGHLVASSSTPARSPITTHVLDSAMGLPAKGLSLSLLKLDEQSGIYEILSQGVTNDDGRVGNLLPPGSHPVPGKYRMFFDTGAYLDACRAQHPSFFAAIPFYPEVTIDFHISPDKTHEHYHIPLLLSPYGYSTYRGS